MSTVKLRRSFTNAIKKAQREANESAVTHIIVVLDSSYLETYPKGLENSIFPKPMILAEVKPEKLKKGI